jgi:hypothetical protein
LRAANADAARSYKLTFTTVSQREQHDVFAVAMTRQLAWLKLAVFEPDAIPRSLAFA